MHINIENKTDCCGCGACAAVCPVGCIAMLPDDEGFLSPQVDAAQCTECGLCLKICPWLEQSSPAERISPPTVFAAWHTDDEIRRLSSSGGVFSALAGEILARKGIVVGAAFDDNMACRHIMIDNIADLPRLRGSKYVQSEIPVAIFHTIGTELKAGRDVLFSGCPCQVAGLRNFLAKDYENLFCCDIICHGVPSPQFFRQHITHLHKPDNPLDEFRVRDKTKGWNKFGVRSGWSNGKTMLKNMFGDPYMAAFLKNHTLRESCYACKFTTTERQGDLTIADFWKVAAKYPQYDTDDKGTSLVLVNTAKGQQLLDCCKPNLFTGAADLEQAIAGNPMLQKPAERPATRDTFYPDTKHMTIHQLRRKYRLHPAPAWRKVLGRIKRQIQKVYGLRSVV